MPQEKSVTMKEKPIGSSEETEAAPAEGAASEKPEKRPSAPDKARRNALIRAGLALLAAALLLVLTKFSVIDLIKGPRESSAIQQEQTGAFVKRDIMASLAAEKLLADAEGDERTGIALVVKALQAPIRQIAENAGVEGAIVLEKIKGSKNVNYGYDVAKDEYVDMIKAGIVDPTKVCRSAIQNAASVSAILLTTESLVADIPEPAPAAPAMGDMKWP